MPDTQSKLSDAQRERAREILAVVRREIATAANGDAAIEFSIRRYVFTRLMHDERSSPMQRRTLKVRKFDAQRGVCTICRQPLEQIGHTHLHRHDALNGYTNENTDLVHAECHRKQQAERNYS